MNALLFKTVRSKLAQFQTIFIILFFCTTSTFANTWPQEITTPSGTIIVYQPQPESLIGNLLQGRAAMSLELKDNSEPIFGAFWFSAKIDTNGDEDSALVHNVKVTKVTWPDSDEKDEARFTEIVDQQLAKTSFDISMSRLSASLETAEQTQQSLENLKHDAPKIVFKEQLAVLLLFDGKPKFTDIENSQFERVLNTPFAVARDKKSGAVYLSSGALWYQAKDPMGPWTITTQPPAELVKIAPKTSDAKPATIPEIVVATEPTELISTTGKPNWQSLTGGKLLYVTNTETPWLRDVSKNEMYILLSGRWFKSSSKSGPWAFVRADHLPDSFKEIPPDSDIGGLRVSVAGTEEAQDAMYDAQIPQTAAIKRSNASLTVEYDGEPKFEAIPGTQISYAVNTAAQVLLIDKHYYAVDNGVWYESSSAKGPWKVADKVPSDEIAKIPPSSPVYNTTYVQIYDSTPEVVYVGYTPGYMWSFPYYGVPIYGTGWYYPPYWGAGYYPRPPTWGFHVGYNPWTGWNFGVSWSNGFFTVGIGWSEHWGNYGSGWYGGGGYRPPVFINNGDINIGNSINIGNRNKIDHHISNNNLRANQLGQVNLYNRANNRARNADPAVVQRDMQRAKASSTRDNNVYADKNGNVSRLQDGKWQDRNQGQWKPQESIQRLDTIGLQHEKGQPLTDAQRDKMRQETEHHQVITPEYRPQTSADRSATMQNYGSSATQTRDHQSLQRAQSARQRGTMREMGRMSQGTRRR